MHELSENIPDTLIARRTLSRVADAVEDAARVVDSYRWFIYRYCCSAPPLVNGDWLHPPLANLPPTTSQPHSLRTQPHHPTHSDCTNAHWTVHTAHSAAANVASNLNVTLRKKDQESINILLNQKLSCKSRYFIDSNVHIGECIASLLNRNE